MTFGDYVYEKTISKNEEAVEDVKADECFHAKLEKKKQTPNDAKSIQHSYQTQQPIKTLAIWHVSLAQF